MSSTTGNKDVLVQRVLVALYPQHASVIAGDQALPAQAVNAQSIQPPSSSQAQAAPFVMQRSPYSMPYAFSAIPSMPSLPSGGLLSGGVHTMSQQPNSSPRVQVHLRAATSPAPAPAPQYSVVQRGGGAPMCPSHRLFPRTSRTQSSDGRTRCLKGWPLKFLLSNIPQPPCRERCHLTGRRLTPPAKKL